MSDAGPLPSKHAALAVATGARDDVPPPQYIAAPRPGYAAPIDALTFSRPEVAASPGGRHQAHDPDWHPNNPFNNPPPQSPLMPSTPHPLQPPMTPITPVFARPQRADSASPDVKFANEKPPIRGDGEDTLLPRRGERGDDFWRRFSMVVKEENTKKGPKDRLVHTRFNSEFIVLMEPVVNGSRRQKEVTRGSQPGYGLLGPFLSSCVNMFVTAFCSLTALLGCSWWHWNWLVHEPKQPRPQTTDGDWRS